jgi:hypothetical protein
MANKERGLVEIELGGKVRTLNYDLNAMAELEDKLGIEVSEMENMKMSIKNVRAMLWAGLIHEDEELTEKEVGAMVNMQNMNYVQERLTEAFVPKND